MLRMDLLKPNIVSKLVKHGKHNLYPYVASWKNNFQALGFQKKPPRVRHACILVGSVDGDI